MGIDVKAKYKDIRRIVLKYFSVPGVHCDDLVQDVVETILRRNGQPSAFDPSRGAFSTYVYRIGWMTAARLANKQRRVRAEQLAAGELAMAA